MPTPEQILAGAAQIANEWWRIALGWHIVLAVALVALASGWRPSTRLAAGLSALPLVSVSVASWAFGNPFNGSMFALLALLLLGLSFRLERAAVQTGPAWSTVSGIIMVAFGWAYPHFLEQGIPWSYLYAAPFGIIPCPTLSAVVGLALLGNAYGGRAWSTVLGISGVVYGLIGTFRLGVQIDLVLLAGAVLLLVAAGRAKRTHTAVKTVDEGAA